MRFTLAGAEHTFDDDRLMYREASALQKATGMTVTEWTQGLKTGDIDCIAALIWLTKQREGDTSPFAEFDFDLSTFDVVREAEPASPPNGSGVQEGAPSP